MRAYKRTIEDLSEVLNRSRSKKEQDIAEEFRSILKTLYEGFKIEVSTKFLRGLIKNPNNLKKSQRVKYLLRKAGLKTYRRNRYFKGFVLQKWRTEIKEFKHIEGKAIYKRNLSLTEEEARQIFEIKEVEKKTGVELYSKAQEDFNKKQNIRTAVNLGGGVAIAGIRNQNIGRFFRSNQKEVLFFIKGY